MIKAIKWLWQLPQNLVAFFLEGVLCKASDRGECIEGNQIIYSQVLPASVSLGDYIFMTNNNEKVKLHELGHCKQSDILGPLYLVVIGLPSMIHNIVHAICGKFGIEWDYYKFYTESWANKLAGIEM